MKQTINFLYFINNVVNIKTALVGAFGERMGNHFQSKLEGFIGESKRLQPEHIIKLIMDMSDSNKEIFLEWIDNDYNYKSYDISSKQ